MTLDSPISARTLSTVGAPERERIGLFEREFVENFSVDLAFRSTGTRPTDAEFAGYRGRRIEFGALRFSPHTTLPVGASRRRSRLLISLHKAGELVVAQGGRERRVGPGDIYFIDPASPFRIETEAIRANLLFLPPEPLRALVPQFDALTATPFKAHDGAGALFGSMFDELFAIAPQLTEAVADRIVDALPHVFAAALGTLEGGQGAVPSALKLLHKQRIRRFALEHLGEPELDANMIAEGAGLSPRYVHRLFDDEPVTLMKWVWGQRLDRARADLATPALRSRSIGEIAYGWGFSSVAHFSRAFRERFGQSPRELRRSSA
ncbi:MAG TPA: helix-turn-helix domain-containing protein [Polyangiaceae bacterium]|nr:helix-turn-helix domain-containing protein [Polyangiaceae bacterium]